MNYSQRRQKVVNLLSAFTLDALILCQPENIRYFCGFSGSDGVLLITSEQLVFLTDSRYTTQAKDEVSADSVVEYKVQADGVVAQLTSSAVARIGFEAGLAYGVVKGFQEKGGSSWSWVHLRDELHTLRLQKSKGEISLISKAADLNTLGLAEVETMIRPGVQENEIARLGILFQCP